MSGDGPDSTGGQRVPDEGSGGREASDGGRGGREASDEGRGGREASDGGQPAAHTPGAAVGQDEVGRAGYRHLAKAVLYREYLLFVRYPANALGGIVVSVFFFGLLFYGGRMIAGQALTDTIEGIIVGYFLWSLSTGAYQGIYQDIGSEVQWGTLERHVMTPFGFAPVALLKGVAKLVRGFLISTVVLAAMLLMTGRTLELPVVTIVVLASLAITSVLGIGFAAGGVTVLYKRISNWLGLLQFLFIVLISAPAFDLGWTKFLPLAMGSALLQRAMIDGTRLWELPLADLGMLVAVAVGYLGGGYLVFQLATRRARNLGVLGDY
jgi:ABC-2 type transport system permease protein